MIDLSKIFDDIDYGDLYFYQRMFLVAIIYNAYKDRAWKSWLDTNGFMHEEHFIAGISTPEGDFVYHFRKLYWDMLKVQEFDKAPNWNAASRDITRLWSLVDNE